MVDLLKLVRNVPDFPIEGIQFKDITTVVADAAGLKDSCEKMAALFKDKGIEKVIGVEARGYIFGAVIAYILNVGFILVRKPGKLPADTIQISYDLEYGSNTIEMHRDAIKKGEKVLIVDDLLATGGTVDATIKLVEKAGGVVDGIVFLIELTGSLHGRDKLKGYDVKTVLDIPVDE